jgi:hypothetical protein
MPFFAPFPGRYVPDDPLDKGKTFVVPARVSVAIGYAASAALAIPDRKISNFYRGSL